MAGSTETWRSQLLARLHAPGQGHPILLRGPNGVGKTQLLRQLAGWSTAWAASGEAPLPAALYLPEDPLHALVGHTVASEFRYHGVPVPMDLQGWRHRSIRSLSRGEQRWVAIRSIQARATASTWVLLDEALTDLDADRTAALLDWLRAHPRSVLVDHGPTTWPGFEVVECAPSSSPTLQPIPLPEGMDVHWPRVADPLTGLRFPARTLKPGLTVLVGSNGSGKTRELHVRAGVLLPSRSRMLLLGQTVEEHLHATSMFPAPGVDPTRHPWHLSRGEQQRLALHDAFARAVPGEDVLLLDEPENHLDGAGRVALRDALAQFVAAGGRALLATHEPELQGLCHHRWGVAHG